MVERACGDFVLPQLFRDGFSQPLVQAGANVADEAQLVALVEAQQKWAKVAASSPGRCPSAHNGVERLRCFHLHPILAAQADVVAIDALSDNSFQIFLSRQLIELLSPSYLMIGEANPGRRAKEPAQEFLALEKRCCAQIVAVAEKEVENVVGDRRPRNQLRRRRSDVHPLLHPLENATALAIQNDNLTIENGLAGAERLGKGGELGILPCDVIPRSRLQRDSSIGNRSQRASTVPFDLKQPAGI